MWPTKCTHINSSARSCLSRCYMWKWKFQHSTRYAPTSPFVFTPFNSSHFNEHSLSPFWNIYFQFEILSEAKLCWQVSLRVYWNSWFLHTFFTRIYGHSPIHATSKYAISGLRNLRNVKKKMEQHFYKCVGRVLGGKKALLEEDGGENIAERKHRRRHGHAAGHPCWPMKTAFRREHNSSCAGPSRICQGVSVVGFFYESQLS